MGTSDVNKDFTFKAKNKAKDHTFKAKDQDYASLEFEDWTTDYGTRYTYTQTIVCK